MLSFNKLQFKPLQLQLDSGNAQCVGQERCYIRCTTRTALLQPVAFGSRAGHRSCQKVKSRCIQLNCGGHLIHFRAHESLHSSAVLRLL